MNNASINRLLKALCENIALWLIAYVLCSYVLLEPSRQLISMMSEDWLNIAGLASGVAIFGSLYLMQEHIISPHSNLYRILYAVGCIGLAMLNANNLPVFTLQIVFVLYLCKKMLWR